MGKRKGVKGNDSVHLFCLSSNCSGQQLGKIKTWIKKLDIQGLGDVFIEALNKPTSYLTPASDKPVFYTPLESVADIYRLHEGPRHGALVFNLGMPRAEKVLAEIDKKRELPLPDFLGSLGLDGLGRRRAGLVQQALPGEFDTLEDWLSGKLVTLAKEVGLPNAAEGIYAQIKVAQPLITELLGAGVKVKKSTTEKPMAKPNQLVFVLTGKFPEKKEHYHNKIVAAGHAFTETYSKAVSYVVAADPASGSSKLKKAAKDGVPVISDAKLLTLLAQ